MTENRSADPVHDPDGREVVVDARTRAHLARRRPAILEHLDTALHAVAFPDFREDDPVAGRERFYLQHLLKSGRWLRVVVDFNETPGWIVTVMIQNNDPRQSK